jgi:Tol biopolymer transport system component
MTVSSIQFRWLVVLAIFGSAAACASDRVTGNAPASPPQSPPHPAGPPSPPPSPAPHSSILTDAVRYDRSSPSHFADGSSFVLLPNGLFRTEYGSFAYSGTYTRADSVVEFAYDDWFGQGTASGRLRGDQLVITFDGFMTFSDFESGTYTWSSPPIDERIYIADTEGSGNATFVVRGSWPSWSPDGRRLAFHRDGQVCIIEVGDSRDSCLAPGGFASWSPDGQRIVFAHASGISVMPGAGSDITTLIGHHFRSDTIARWDNGVGKPAWSPDGQTIAFEAFGDDLRRPPELYLMRADGSGRRRLTVDEGTGPTAESDPAWSNDGQSIVFWSSSAGIARVAASGGAPVTIYRNVPTVSYGTRPAPSPDGVSVAYTVTDSTSGATSIWITGRGLVVANGRDPAWSPDGKRIAFVRRGD